MSSANHVTALAREYQRLALQSSILPGKMTVAQMNKIFHASYGSQCFIEPSNRPCLEPDESNTEYSKPFINKFQSYVSILSPNCITFKHTDVPPTGIVKLLLGHPKFPLSCVLKPILPPVQ